MNKVKFSRKGVVLFIVLCTLLVVTSLATVVLSLITSHARLTYHQRARIQSYYAAMAGVNYGLEILRTNGVAAAVSGSPYTLTFDDGDFRPSILTNPSNGVSITVRSAGSSGCSSPPAPSGGACVSATADYTYTQ